MNRKLYSHANHGAGGTETDRAGHLTDHSEYRDLNFRAIYQFLIGLGVIIAISYFAMYGIMKLFESQYEKNDIAPPPTADAVWKQPAVDVQTSPNVDLREFDEKQESILMTSDPATRKISIDEAIEETLREGLPYRSGTAGAESTAAEDDEATTESATDSGSDTDDSEQVSDEN